MIAVLPSRLQSDTADSFEKNPGSDRSVRLVHLHRNLQHIVQFSVNFSIDFSGAFDKL